MHNPGMSNIPRSVPMPLPPFNRMPPSDFLPFDMGGHMHNQPPVFLHHRQPSRFRTHHAFSGNQFYNRTKRKRECSDVSRNNGVHHDATEEGLKGQTPWNQKGRTYTEGVIGLHEEIEDFVQWMVPTESEHYLRRSVIDRLGASIKEIFPGCVVQIFGSFRTGLYLPTSDIDLVLVGHWDQIPFEIVGKGIEAKNLAKPGTLQLLEHAAVPIIKLADRLTDIKVDISFNMTSGLESVELIKHYEGKFPAMAKLIYVIKQFLLQRDLNEVYTGGLSSYALILMVVSFLQLHPRKDAGNENANLGVLLIEFFELYGRHFNYSNTAIRISGGGSYVSKEELRNTMSMGLGQGSLCIQDPYNPENDIGKSSYGIPVVKMAFEKAYMTLTNLVTSQKDIYPKGGSILNHVVRVSDDVISFRKRVASMHSIPNSISTDTSEPNGDASADSSQPASNAVSANSSQNAPEDENDDQTLSEDPILPTKIIPTPSRDVMPRELPLKTFEVKSAKTPDEAIVTAKETDLDNMSGVSSATSSTSTQSNTDTDSDVLECRVGASSPSGSPSSAMSISPASSEVGIQNRLNRHSTGHERQTSQPSNTANGSGQPKNGSGRSHGHQYWNSNRRPPQKERSDNVLNWRKIGPDQNKDWRNHEEPVARTQERKDSWREDEPAMAGNIKVSAKTDGSSSSDKESTPSQKPPLSQPIIEPTDNQSPNITKMSSNTSTSIKSSTDGNTSSSHSTANKNEQDFKTRPYHKRKKRNQKSNKMNNNHKNNINNSTQPDSVNANNHPVASKEDKRNGDKTDNAATKSDKNSSQNQQQQSQSRFSSKSGQSKPKR